MRAKAHASMAAIAIFLAASPWCNASLVDLGPAAGDTILGLDGATVHLSSGPLVVNGNVGIGDNGTLNFDGGGTLNGAVSYAQTASVNAAGQTITGGIHQIDFSGIQKAVQNAVNFANSLTATQAFSSITNAMTLNSTGSLNVISVGGDIHLSGGNLTLNGSASDTFVFKISGTMELSGDTNILLTGGLTPNNVIWDFIGSGSQVQTSGKSNTAGIFLAPDRVININGGIHNSEFISGVSLSFQSNPIVNTPVPEVTPSSVIFGFIGLVIAFGSRRTLMARMRATPAQGKVH